MTEIAYCFRALIINIVTEVIDHFRALEGHTNGDLPWAWCDEGLDDQMAEIVGKLLDFCPFHCTYTLLTTASLTVIDIS